MLVLYRRHTQECPHRKKGRRYKKCVCPIWFDWRISGRRIRKQMGLRDWAVAQSRARDMEATGLVAGGAPVTIEDALTKFIETKSNSLKPSTLRKHKLLEKRLKTFCADRGLVFLRQIDAAQLVDFRNTWKLNARTEAKTIERLRSFFSFCLELDWIEKNPAKAIKAGRVEDANVHPFSDTEVTKILKACDTVNGNGARIKALTMLMLETGLRIGDAATISRDRFVKYGSEWQLQLRTAKTGTDVLIPIRNQLVKAIRALPGEFPFWSGDSSAADCTSVWQEAYRKLFTHAKISGHAHRFRHTFAKNLLVKQVPIETVSVLLGHTKIAITEKHYARFVPERQAAI